MPAVAAQVGVAIGTFVVDIHAAVYAAGDQATSKETPAIISFFTIWLQIN